MSSEESVSLDSLEEDNLQPASKTPTGCSYSFLVIYALVIALLGGCLGAGIVWGLLRTSVTPPVGAGPVVDSPCRPPTSVPPKNFIFVVGDGNGPAAVSLTRLLKKAPLVVDDYLVGAIHTSSFNSLITDSAASASAYATGTKTINGYLSVDPTTNTSLGTIFEAAKAKGFSTGIITTADISDATPAAFTSHSVRREYNSFIVSQHLNQRLEIIMGGGAKYFENETLDTALDKGYTIVYNKTQLAGIPNSDLSLPFLGLFAHGDMSFSLDRSLTDEPNLVDMVAKALDLLIAQDNADGFMLLVEESAIDDAGHVWDAGALCGAGLSLDTTVDYILNFAKKRNDTLVLITADHETGGLAIGRDDFKYLNTEFISGQKRSNRYAARHLVGALDRTYIAEVIVNATGIVPTEAEVELLVNVTSMTTLQHLVGTIVSTRAHVGWTTGWHSGIDVNLYGYGPGIDNFCGTLDNTEISTKIAKLFGLDMKAANERVKNYPIQPAGVV